MINMIVIGALVLILGGAAFYVYQTRKSGGKCIGCPHSHDCSGNCGDCRK